MSPELVSTENTSRFLLFLVLVLVHLLLILGAAAWLDAPWSRIYESIGQIRDDV